MAAGFLPFASFLDLGLCFVEESRGYPPGFNRARISELWTPHASKRGAFLAFFLIRMDIYVDLLWGCCGFEGHEWGPHGGEIR